MDLRDLPPGTLPVELLQALEDTQLRALREYGAGRQRDVDRGAETPELAALLVEKFAAGMAESLRLLGLSTSVVAEADRLVRSIDPEFEVHRKARWDSRPAGVSRT